MSNAQLLEEARQRGIILEAAGEKLRCRYPQGSLTPDLEADLVQHKGEILAVLQFKQAGTGLGLCPGPEKCAGCYSIGVVDGNEQFLHPPKAPIRWLQ